MLEEILQGRELEQTVAELKAHVQLKINSLPTLAQRFHLNATSITSLTQHMQDELDYLANLPEGLTLREVMDSHFARGAQVGDFIVGKEDS